MKSITLTQGKVALVDDEDFEWLSQWKWQYDKGYARRSGYIPLGNGKYSRPYIAMHRELWERHNGPIPEGYEIDHKDGPPWDNQKYNLRCCKHSDNGKNQRKPKNNTTGYKNVYKRAGVDKHPNWKPYQVIIFSDGKLYSYKCYYDLLNAAWAANQAAVKHFGEFAKLNELPEGFVFCPELERPRDTSTGFIGICLTKNGTYKTYIGRRYLGTYKTLERAIEIRRNAEETI